MLIVFFIAGSVFGYGISKIQIGLYARNRLKQRRERLNSLIFPYSLDDEEQVTNANSYRFNGVASTKTYAHY